MSGSGLDAATISADMASFGDFQNDNNGTKEFLDSLIDRKDGAGKDKPKPRRQSKETVTKKDLEALQQQPVIDDAAQKAAVERKIHAYLEKFPEKLSGLKLPKGFEHRWTLEQLKKHLANIEHELGKSGGIELAKRGFVWLCQVVEKFQAQSHILPYTLDHFGDIASQAVTDRQMPDGRVSQGPMIPLLDEFVIKYDAWFSSRIESRIALEMLSLMLLTHKMNTDAKVQEAMQGAKKNVSFAAAEAAKKL